MAHHRLRRTNSLLLRSIDSRTHLKGLHRFSVGKNGGTHWPSIYAATIISTTSMDRIQCLGGAAGRGNPESGGAAPMWRLRSIFRRPGRVGGNFCTKQAAAEAPAAGSSSRSTNTLCNIIWRICRGGRAFAPGDA